MARLQPPRDPLKVNGGLDIDINLYCSKTNGRSKVHLREATLCGTVVPPDPHQPIGDQHPNKLSRQ